MLKSPDIGNLLNEHNIRPSYQRVRIMQYLLEFRSHPTVDEIYNALVAEIPTLSKTTVYNTLGLFISKKITQPISIEENQTRYDADASVHGHFKCDLCGKIFDFTVDNIMTSGLDDFEVNSRNVFFKGICPACHNNEPHGDPYVGELD